ncbi:MAG: aldehyde dehydrogenase family protein [Pyrinomonadaceae bacterium]
MERECSPAGAARIDSRRRHFHPPTVLAGVDHDHGGDAQKGVRARCCPVMTFADRGRSDPVSPAIPRLRLNRQRVDARCATRASASPSRIDAGTVMVNEVLYTHGIAQTPWGGVKQSGLGRTHGRLGLLELVSAPHSRQHAQRRARLVVV